MTMAVAPTAGLLMLTRYPQPGKTKTRLISALGMEGAAQLQRQMTEYLVERLRTVCHRYHLALQIHFAGGTMAQMAAWLGADLCFHPQSQGDLGNRLKQAAAQAFAHDLTHVLMIGSDCPGITAAHISQALTQLKTYDLVLGPAEDGGYYLIGLNTPHPKLFENICWGQSCVLQQTIAIAACHHWSVALLPSLPDIDRPEDLPWLQAYWDAPHLPCPAPRWVRLASQ